MNPTQRFCLSLDLRDDPELIDEYIYWHRKENIRPEIPEGIRAVGILNMEIYRLGRRLFMIIEAGPGFDFERDMQQLSALPGQKEWEEFVSRFQESLPGKASVEKWSRMERIFSL